MHFCKGSIFFKTQKSFYTLVFTVIITSRLISGSSWYEFNKAFEESKENKPLDSDIDYDYEYERQYYNEHISHPPVAKYSNSKRSQSRASSGVYSLISYLTSFRNKFTTPAPKVALIGQTWMNLPVVVDEHTKFSFPALAEHGVEKQQLFWPDKTHEKSIPTCGISTDVAKIGVAIHNIFRERHSTEPLQLSEYLSKRAQACASYYCGRPESAFHTCPHRVDAGENIYQVGELSDSDGKSVVQNGILDWYKEIQFYNFEKPLCEPLNPSSLHFTQMIWRSARQIGFGLCSCPKLNQKGNRNINTVEDKTSYNDNNNSFSNKNGKTVFVALYDTLQRNGLLRRRCSSVIQNVLPPK